jgi:hypothetical protein
LDVIRREFLNRKCRRFFGATLRKYICAYVGTCLHIGLLYRKAEGAEYDDFVILNRNYIPEDVDGLRNSKPEESSPCRSRYKFILQP